MKKIFLIACLLFCITAFSQTYIPEAAVSKAKATVVLTYNANPGGNRPGASLKFADGQEFGLAVTCDDPYPWCIRNADFDVIGYIKLDFLQNKKIAKIDIKKNADSTPYLKYLNTLKGTYKKVP